MATTTNLADPGGTKTAPKQHRAADAIEASRCARCPPLAPPRPPLSPASVARAAGGRCAPSIAGPGVGRTTFARRSDNPEPSDPPPLRPRGWGARGAAGAGRGAGGAAGVLWQARCGIRWFWCGQPSRFSHARSQAPGVRLPQAIPPRRGPARAAPRGHMRPASRCEGKGPGAHLKRHGGSLDRSRPRGRHDGRARQPAEPAVLPPPRPGPPPARPRVRLRGRERPRQLLQRDRRPFKMTRYQHPAVLLVLRRAVVDSN